MSFSLRSEASEAIHSICYSQIREWEEGLFLCRSYQTCPMWDLHVHCKPHPTRWNGIKDISPLSNLPGHKPFKNTRGICGVDLSPSTTAWQHRALCAGCQSVLMAKELTGRGCSGDVAPQSAPGVNGSTASCAKSLVLQSKVRAHRRWNRLRGRAIVQEVCLQSCQFRSPGQKSLYLLKQMLCRTKWQADFKAGRCAEPRAAITRQQAPARPALLWIPPSDTGSLFSPCTPLPLKTFWCAPFLPADHSRGRIFKDVAPSHWNQNHPALHGCKDTFCCCLFC